MVEKTQFRHQRNSRETHGNARAVKGGHAVIGKSTLSMNENLESFAQIKVRCLVTLS